MLASDLTFLCGVPRHHLRWPECTWKIHANGQASALLPPVHPSHIPHTHPKLLPSRITHFSIVDLDLLSPQLVPTPFWLCCDLVSLLLFLISYSGLNFIAHNFNNMATNTISPLLLFSWYLHVTKSPLWRNPVFYVPPASKSSIARKKRLYGAKKGSWKSTVTNQQRDLDAVQQCPVLTNTWRKGAVPGKDPDSCFPTISREVLLLRVQFLQCLGCFPFLPPSVVNSSTLSSRVQSGPLPINVLKSVPQEQPSCGSTFQTLLHQLLSHFFPLEKCSLPPESLPICFLSLSFP